MKQHNLVATNVSITKYTVPSPQLELDDEESFDPPKKKPAIEKSGLSAYHARRSKKQPSILPDKRKRKCLREASVASHLRIDQM